MYKIDAKLRKNIETTFGDYGKDWLKNLPVIINKLIIKWDLYDISVVKNLSFNFVIFAKSQEYGDVLLKICPKEGDYNQEYMAIKAINSPILRSCYQFDENLNSLLLEYLTPGDTLHYINDITKEIKVGCTIIKKLPKESAKDTVIPSYIELLDKAFKYTIDNSLGGKKFHKYILLAKDYFFDLKSKYNDNYICHGDFHHDNIIYDEKKGWIVIDPKGFKSFWFGDLGRFLINQIWKIPLIERKDKLDYIINEVRNNLMLPKDIILKAIFVETVLCYSWHFQGNLTKDELKKIEDKMISEIEVYTM